MVSDEERQVAGNADQEATAVSYRVLARKYRPADFSTLIGQDAMVRTLTNAFASSRIAQAYMLTGVRGVGKTTTARILARALNYVRDGVDHPTIELEQPGEHCAAIMAGTHVDVIEMDAASHTGIDDIREITGAARYRPAIARYKVYIIDEVHMLSRQAFNGLLKTLEEPPEHVKFIFATTEIRKVPVTVLSRCQRFDLKRVDAELLIAHLASIAKTENVEVSGECLAVLARASEGSVRDALSLLDQAIAHGSGHIEIDPLREMLGLSDRARIIDLFEQVMRGDIAAAILELAQLYAGGADPAAVLSDLAEFVHLLTRLKYVPQAAADVSLSEIERTKGQEFADQLSVRVLGRAWQILLKGIAEVQAADRPLAAADMVLVRLTHAADLPTPDELARQLGNVDPATSAAMAPATASTAPNKDQAAPVAATDRAPDQPRPQMAASGGGDNNGGGAQARALPDPAVEPTMLAVADLPAMVALAEQHRDLRIRNFLTDHVRPIRFQDGRFEFSLAGAPPTSLVSDLSNKLSQWTNRRWLIVTSREGGGETLKERREAAFGSMVVEVENDPAVAAVLRRFPGAKVVDVKVRAEPAADQTVGSGDETDMDEFFQ